MKKLPKRKYLSTLFYALKNSIHHDSIYPFYASFKVISVCGFTCTFCDMWKRKSPTMLTTEQVIAILDNLTNSSIIAVSLEGGDPLLRNDLLDILKYASHLPFFLEITTSARHLERYPLEEYCRYLDFLHISIDEGHENLSVYKQLKGLQKLGMRLGVQIVVTTETLGALEGKIVQIREAGARAVVMPAAHLDGTPDLYPDPQDFRTELRRLKAKYPDTIITPDYFLDNINAEHGCSASSIVIDSDGSLFYPCRVLQERPVSLLQTPLMEFLKSNEALRWRSHLKNCTRRCGWYQYFAVPPDLSWRSLNSVVSTYRQELMNHRQNYT